MVQIKIAFGRICFKNIYSGINGKWYNENNFIRFDDYSISPITRQVLLQWGYELVKLKMVCYNLFLRGKEKAAKHYENNKEI